MNIVMLAEALTLGVPIIILSSASPLASFLVKMLIVVLTTLLTLGIFFGPKVAVVTGLWESESSSSDHNVRRGSFERTPARAAFGEYKSGGSREPSPRGSPKVCLVVFVETDKGNTA